MSKHSKSVETSSQHSSDDEIQAPIKTPVKIDAFKFLMESRNKRIGTNSPGKERLESESSPKDQSDNKKKLKKRKLAFEEWAEKKGRSKAKIIDEAREKQIEKQLEGRAKRLKEMLSIDTPNKPAKTKSEDCENSDSDYEIFPKKKSVSEENNVDSTQQNRDDYFLENTTKETSKKLTKKYTRSSTKRKRTSSLNTHNTTTTSEDLIEIKTPETEICNSNDFKKRNLSDQEMLSPNRVRTPWKMKLKFIEKENIENNIVSPEDNGVVFLSSDEEDLNENITNTKNSVDKSVKLVPIFSQKQKKQNDKSRTTNGQNRELEESYCSYPTISHMQQKSSSPFWNLPEAKLPLRKEIEHLQYDFSKLTIPKDFLSCKVNDDKCKISTQKPTFLTEKEVNEFLENYEKEYSESSVRNLFEILKELPKEQRKRFANEDSQDICVAEESDCIVWSDKYNPISRETIIGNQENLSKLATWLEAWLTPSTKRTRYDSGSSSGNEFVTENEQDIQKPNQSNVDSLLILLGPHGVGKTSSVYTICDNLGMTVIEINASSKRSGKKILQDLQEATRSHRVKPGDSEALSLLLVEDADIVFDIQDEGFVPALKTLSKTSLRPIVLTASDENCEHLKFFMENYPVLRFGLPLETDLVLRMKLLCLIEKLSVPSDAINAIVARSRGDVRKTILEMQFWSSKNSDFHQFNLASSCHNLGELWWNLSQHDLVHIKDTSDILAYADSIQTPLKKELDNEPTLLPWSQKCLTNNLSLTEDYQLYNDSTEVLKEMLQWLLEKTLENNGANLQNITRAAPTFEDVRWRNSIHSTHKELNKIIPSNIQLDRASLAVDYQASLRQICRLEYDRHKNNRKRGNRFYHYLRSASIQLKRDDSRILYRTLSSSR